MNPQVSLNDSLYISPTRPNRTLIVWFVRKYQFVVGFLVSVLVFLSTFKFDKLLTLVAIAAYWMYLVLKSRYRGKNVWGQYYAQFISSMMLVVGITVLLKLLYQTPYLNKIGSESSIWLLYLLPLFTMSQHGNRRQLGLSIGFTLLAIFVTDPARGPVFIDIASVKPITFPFLSKIIWCVLLTLILHIFLRYMGDTIADLNLILNVQDRLREAGFTFRQSLANFDEDAYLEKAVEMMRADFGYDHVNVFRVGSNGRQLDYVAAACQNGKRLVGQNFSLDIEEKSSIIGYVVKTGQAYLSNNVKKDPNYMFHLAFPHTCAELAVPIIVRGRLFGVLDVQVHKTDYFLDHDIQSAEILANHVGWVMDNAKKQEHLEWIEGIIDNIAESIFTRDALEDTLQQIADAAYRELSSDLVVMYCYGSNDKQDVVGPIFAGQSLHPEIFGKSVLTPDNIVHRLRHAEHRIYWCEDTDQVDLATDELFRPSSFHISTGKPPFIVREQIRANVIIRLTNDSECLGVLFLNFRNPRRFSEWDKRRYFSFAHLTSIAIQRMQGYQQERRLEIADLANSIHDTLIGDTLGLYKLLDAIPIPNSEADRQKCTEYVEQAKLMTDRMHGHVRSIIGLLKHDLAIDFPSELVRLREVLVPAFGVEIEDTWQGDVSIIAPAPSSMLCYVLREAMTNAIFRGKARKIIVSTTVTDCLVNVSIEDNGKGFAPEAIERRGGLHGMQERVSRLGGRFEIQSEVGIGTKLLIQVPLPT